MESVIDFVLCNEKMYDKIEKMNIDDNWEIMKISDHNLIQVNVSVGRGILAQFPQTLVYRKSMKRDFSKFLHNGSPMGLF